MKKIERVIAYIDGFNLYFGMLDAGYTKMKWLNIKALIESLLKPHQTLSEVYYFTSRVRDNPTKQKRQSTYIDALLSTGIKVIYGHYQANTQECYRCGNIWNDPKEKMTDVNIATALVVDAFQDKFDMALLVSGDSDLVPPIKEIHNHFPLKRVFVAFPPSRLNVSVKKVAKGSMVIGRKKLLDAQFQPEVKSKTGYILRKPIDWM